MRLLSDLSSSFKNHPEDKEIISNEIRRSNFTRILIISSLGILVTLVYIIFFRIHLYKGTTVDIQWRTGIIISHVVMMMLFIISLLVALYLRKHNMELSPQAGWLIFFLFVTILIWGVVCVSMDQLVTPSITAFILTLLILAAGILLSPVQALGYFLFAYAIYVIGMMTMQPDSDLLLTNLMNGFSTALSGFGLSLIFWKNNLVRYRQSRLIEKQKKELVQKNEALTLSNATKDKFFSIISHDLRGPISGTLSLTQLMNNKEASDNPKEQKYMMDLLQDNLGNAYKLLENLLYWSETQTGFIRFNPEVVDLKVLIDTNIDLLKANSAAKNLSVIDKTDADMAFGDREMLDTVLRNLLSNAVKFSFHSGVIEISSRFVNNNGNLMIELSIKDEGTGVEQSLLNNLFRIDKKVSMPGTQKETGTGLGLILCKEFIEKNGGAIRVHNNPDKGSTFIFTIPAAD